MLKVKNELRDVVIYLFTFWFFPLKFFFGEKKDFTKNKQNEGYIYINEFGMESISPNASTYFLTSHLKQIIFLKKIYMLSDRV